jgi:hypothetical protein
MTMHITSLFVCFLSEEWGMTVPAPNFYYNLMGVLATHLSWRAEGRGGGRWRVLARKRKKESREKSQKKNSKVFIIIMSIEQNIRATTFIIKTIIKIFNLHVYFSWLVADVVAMVFFL